MRRFASGVVFAAMAGAFPPVSPVSQTDPTLVVRTVRFYRPDLGRTRVKGLVQIPYSILEAVGTSRGASYTVSVQVRDSTNLTLLQQAWQSRVSDVGAPDAYTVEIVDFAVAPGRYRLDVEVRDSISGHTARAGADLQALSDSDGASDLLLTPEMRLASAEDTVPRPGEFRTGDNLVTAVARVRLTPVRSKVYYLLEAYAGTATLDTMSVAIRDSGSKVVVQTPVVPVRVNAGGSVLKGELDLAGLPEGRYTMAATLKRDGRPIERTAEFVMGGLSETLARNAANLDAQKNTDEGYFGRMTPEQLDSAEAPLIYIAQSGELSPWGTSMSLNAKRRFLTTFWQKRDPTPGADQNERRDQFYRAIEYANRTYREGGRNTVPGWRSDRGRIYARLGTPDDVLRRLHEGRAPSYEVWRYARGRGNFYIFADRTGLGAYELIYSNDLKEPGKPGWNTSLGRDAVGDISQFLNIDLFADLRKQGITPPGQRF